MVQYLIRKVIFLIFTVWAVLTIIFIGLHALPGNPAEVLLSMQPNEQTLKLLEETMGLNQPLRMQYWLYIKNLLSGNLGKSLRTGQAIIEVYLEVFPYTLTLAFASISVSLLIGIPIGILAAVKRGTWWDYFARFFAVIGLSIPAFFLGVLLLLLLAVKLGWFPVMGAGERGDVLDILYHLFLPAFSQGFIISAFIMRISRSSFLEILQQEYIEVARSKGLSEFKVLYKHGLRNALVPIVTVIGLYFNVALGSSIIIEVVFNRPGVGRILVEAILQRDYPLVQSTLVVLSLFIITVNTLTDLIYAAIDPRIKLTENR
ncbi:MAG: ABC transporter permease [Planctomycetota bacterium]|jgi:ABC-type dipeptide/oligopeptide/nickel transport system permease component